MAHKNNPTRKDGKPSLPRCKARYNSAKKMAQRYLQMGFAYKDVMEKLQEDYGYSENSAKDLINKLNREIDAKFDKYAEKVASKQIKRLEALIEESFENGTIKEIQTSIDLLNKLNHLYETKIKVDGNGDFKIKIGKE